MYDEKVIEATYEAQKQTCGKKSQYWDDLEDDVDHWFCLDFARMFGMT